LLLKPQLDLDSLLWIYAAAAAGTPFVSLHAAATASECAAIQLLTGARNPPRAKLAAAPLIVEREVDPEAAFCLILTSGSTGLPKVVVLSRSALLASAAASESNLGLADEERWLLCMSLAHVGGLSIVLRMLAARRTVVLFESGATGLLSRMTELGRCIHEERVTLVSLVPPLLDRLLRDGFQPPRTLRAVLLGGAGCSSSLAGRALASGVPLLTSYGLTETGSQVTARRYAERDAPLPQFGECVSSGHPLAGVEIKIVGERIAVKTASLLSGYVGEATPAVDVDGWFVTSDRGTLGSHGELYVLGRTDSVIVTGGENVDPEEVERALRFLPEIQDACVFGLPCDEFGQRVVAVLVPKAGAAPLELEHLTEQLRSRLARFKLPRVVVIAEALPFTASGKLDRRACAARWAGSMFIESRDSRPQGVVR
jgi:acyl-CoA synthetase (AMP-forming)/AMP-acid ligase II